MFYVATYAGLILVRFLSERNAYSLTLATLFLFSAFRFEVGCDWTGYLNQYFWYQDVALSELPEQREPLWVALFVFQHWLGLPYPWINVISSAIFFLGVHTMARRQPDRLGFLVLLFPILIINMPMAGIRQGAAIGVMCIAFVCFTERRLLQFIVLTGIAGALHSSALVFLLFTPLVRGEYSKIRLLVCVLLAIPGALFLASTQAAEVATFRYLESDADAAGAIFRLGLLSISGMLFLVQLRSAWGAKFPDDVKLATLGSLIMIGVVVLLPFSSVIADRIGYYLVPIQTMILARLPSLVEGPARNMLIVAPYVALFMVFAAWAIYSALFQLCYVPYQTWLLGFPQGRYAF